MSPRCGSGAFRVTQAGAGLAFPPLVGAGCSPEDLSWGNPPPGQEDLMQTLVRGVSEGPGSIGFDLTPHRQVEIRE
ncbi:Hypothetical protein SCLAV_2066 [Streptomyces clavuligerus]|uniref:Uncharacterized protein n=1 Tax=Streptomyces clavuligerus TaxID=1901 RepID=E2Q598_STRCL|nr:Hypothetical protein SCLAV_2066 [Streptomyces clavuligerus]